jgi:GT2 family glycosyltransferase
MIANELNRHPDADIVYSDEDKIDESGHRFDPFFKPDWDPERFLSQNYINHLTVYRHALIREAGGFREGFEGSQDFDLALRIVSRTKAERIRHVPFVLYHWRIFTGARTFSSTNLEATSGAARRALEGYFDAKGERMEFVASRIPGWPRTRRPIPDPAPQVSLIVPTRDRLQLLRDCIDGLLNGTDYPNLDVIVVDNGSSERETLSYLKILSTDPRVKVMRIDGPFNFSALNNEAARAAKGEILGFINNDIDVIEPGWLKEMVAALMAADVGAVGAKLSYGDDTIQHAGVVIGLGGVAGHIEKHAPRSDPGYFRQFQLSRSVSCVTAACMLVKRRVFEAVEGFDEENLTVAYNDVDLCLKIRAAGYRIVLTPYAELYHLESASRGSDVLDAEKSARFKKEMNYMLERWKTAQMHDPYFNPNLSVATEGIEMSYPPRVARPWAAKAGEEAAGTGADRAA